MRLFFTFIQRIVVIVVQIWGGVLWRNELIDFHGCAAIKVDAARLSSIGLFALNQPLNESNNLVHVLRHSEHNRWPLTLEHSQIVEELSLIFSRHLQPTRLLLHFNFDDVVVLFKLELNLNFIDRREEKYFHDLHEEDINLSSFFDDLVVNVGDVHEMNDIEFEIVG